MATEPFPPLYEGQGQDIAKPLVGQTLGQALNNGSDKKVQQRRRKSSGLGGEINAGDTGAPALSTMDILPLSPGMLRAKSERDRKAKPFSKRRKAKSMLRRWKNYALRHTWVTPLAILGVFAFLYAINPTPSNPINRFIFLSYKRPAAPGEKPKYGKGLWDLAFVSFYIVVLSFTREFIMQTMLRPLALYCGLKSRAKQSRFMEQMYTAIYFGFMGPVGLWVMSHTPVWYFNIAGMYEDFPHHTLEADFKFYYLFQAAYWAQQAIVLVLGVEKPRKDYKELVGHHIVSLALISASYGFHFTHMGIAVYITHDISDFFLATSKTLNYIDHPLVGPYFGLFMFVWIYMRHYLNLRIIVSEFYEFKTIGPYGIVWEEQQYKGPLAHYISTFLLCCLQALNLFWLFAIMRIAYRFLFENALEDDRSDYEDEDEEELKKENKEKAAVEDKEREEVRMLAGMAQAPRIEVNGAAVPMDGEAQTSGVTPKVKVQRRKA